MTSLTIESQYLKRVLQREFSAFNEMQDASARSAVDMFLFGKLAVTLFGKLVRDRFSSSVPLSEITSFCVRLRLTYGSHLPVTAIAVEMIIRYELGEEVPISDLPNDQQLSAMVLATCQLVHARGMVDAEIDALLSEIEQVVTAGQ